MKEFLKLYGYIRKLKVTKYAINLTFLLFFIKLAALFGIVPDWLIVLSPLILLTIVLILIYFYGSRKRN
jgi:hypothetical protein